MLTRRELTTYLKANNVDISAPNSNIHLPHEVLIELHKMTAKPGERVYNIHDLTDFKKDNPDITEFDYLRLGSYLEPCFENDATSFVYRYNDDADDNIIILLDNDDNEPERIMLDQVARLLYDMELIDNLD